VATEALFKFFFRKSDVHFLRLIGGSDVAFVDDGGSSVFTLEGAIFFFHAVAGKSFRFLFRQDFFVVGADDRANVFSAAITNFNVVSIEDLVHFVGVGEVFINEFQEQFSDVC
jgi:hypothetical protein